MQTDANNLGEPRDGQQLRVIERLRAARGAPVDFEELIAIGVEHPAVVCYELELSGLPIVQRRDGHRLLFSLPPEPATPLAGAERGRGEPRRRAEPRPPAGARRPAEPHPGGDERTRPRELLHGETRAPRRGWSALAPPRLAVIGAAAAAVLTLAGVMIASSPGGRSGSGEGGRSGAGPTHATAPPAASGSRARGQAPGASSARTQGLPPIPNQLQARTPTVPISPAAAAALESEGHQLLAAGRFSAAIDPLLGAIRASGKSPAQCTEPSSESCLTFAYALYDLGRALRLGGHPSSAVPVLKQRLRIDNQRPVVRQELDLAQGAGA